MRREKFIEFMRHPEKVGTDDLQELEALVSHYPYFQAARMLYLKVLYLQAGTRFRHELKISTVHITDHKRLLHYLNLLPGTHLREVRASSCDISLESGEYMGNRPSDGTIENQDDAIQISLYDRELRPVNSGTEDLEGTDNMLENSDVVSSGYSFFDEKNFSTAGNPVNMKDKNSQLIDDFIESNPGMPKTTAATENIRDLSEENPYDKDELFTETLAKIYTKQKLYEKAIATYIKLSLKYPEKSVYFANRIEKIKEFINNQE